MELRSQYAREDNGRLRGNLRNRVVVLVSKGSMALRWWIAAKMATLRPNWHRAKVRQRIASPALDP